MSDEVKKTSNGLRIKDSSHFAQIIGAVWIAVWSSIKYIKLGVDQVPTVDFLLSGLCIAACFIPAYFSIIMDKVKDIKLGGIS